MAFLDAMIALRPLLPGMALNPGKFLVLSVCCYGIYFLCMAVVTLPVLQPAAENKSQESTNGYGEMESIGIALCSAALAGRLRPADWQLWAERAFTLGTLTDPRLPDVAKAQNVEELCRAALPQFCLQRWDDPLLGDVVLGHLWVRYQKGELPLAEFLHQAAELCQNDPVPFDAEVFYALAEQLEQSGPRSIEKNLERMLVAPALLARKHWDLLRRFADVLP